MEWNEVTFAKCIDGKAECTYSLRNYTEQDKHIRYYTVTRISDEQLEEIKNITTERVQAVLSKYI